MNECIPTPKMFISHIVTSMKDYDETLLETLIKEMDCHLGCRYPSKGYNCETFYEKQGSLKLEIEVVTFLKQWNLSDGEVTYYTDIFMGRENNLRLSNFA